MTNPHDHTSFMGNKAWGMYAPKNKEEPREPEPEMAKVAYVKCTKCGHSVSQFEFVHMMGSTPKFCRCPVGQENIVQTYKEVDVAKRVKTPGA